jgi:hypothetical protein
MNKETYTISIQITGQGTNTHTTCFTVLSREYDAIQIGYLMKDYSNFIQAKLDKADDKALAIRAING